MTAYGKLLILVLVLIFGGILACCPTGDGGTLPPETTTTTQLVPTASPSSTSTTATRPSPTAENSPGPTALLFEDDFSSPSSGWEVGDYDEEGAVGYQDGYYFVSATTEDRWMWGVANQSFGDVDLEVEATQFSGPDNDNNAYGVRCRVQSNNDAYHLVISGDGFWSIQKSIGGSYESLVEWARSDSINQGNDTNNLRVVCDGTRLALYCNGELLGETTDSELSQGDIAFAAVSLEAEGTEIHFDNLTVSEPGR
jgi:hypothetical protein